MTMGVTLSAVLITAINKCDCFIAWLNPEYFESEFCTEELLYARKKGKIILPFGVYGNIKKYMTGNFQFLRDIVVHDPESISFFEILTRIDDTLYGFEEKLAFV